MLTLLLRPAKDIGFWLQLNARGPGVIAALAEEFSLKAAERCKDRGDTTPQEMAAELRIFNARGAAFWTDDSIAQRTLAGVPFLQKLAGSGVLFFWNAQANPCQGGREKIPLLQLAFIVNFRRDTGFLKTPSRR